MSTYKVKATDIQNVVISTENALRILNYANDEINGCLNNLTNEMGGSTGEEYMAKLKSMLGYTEALHNKIDNFRKAVEDFCQKTGMNISVNVSEKAENVEEVMKTLGQQARDFTGK